MYSRVQPRSGILHLLNQPGHVLEEDVVQLLLLHVLQLERRSVLGASHGVVEAEDDKGVSRLLRERESGVESLQEEVLSH